MSLARLAGFDDGLKPVFITDNEGPFTVETTVPRSGTHHAHVIGDTTGAGLNISVASTLSAANGWTWVGFGFRCSDITKYASGTGWKPFVRISDTATTKNNVEVGVTAQGRIGYAIVSGAGDYTGAANIKYPYNAGSDLLQSNTWAYIEVGVRIADSPNGHLIVRINGVELINLGSGAIDTRTGSAATTTRSVHLTGPNDTGATAQFDDIYIVIEDGAGATGFQGPGSVDATPTFTANPAVGFRVSQLVAEVMSSKLTAEPAPPDAPVIGTATLRPTGNAASVTFTPVVGALSYKVSAVEDPMWYYTGTGSPIIVNGAASTTYTYVVQARNLGGYGAASAPSNSVTTVAKPAPPTNLVLTSVSPTSKSLSFTPSPGPGVVEYYDVYTYPDYALYWYGEESPILLDNLIENTEYVFEITASNGSYYSDPAYSNVSVLNVDYVDDGSALDPIVMPLTDGGIKLAGEPKYLGRDIGVRLFDI